MEKYSEGKIHKNEPEPMNTKLFKYCLFLFIMGNAWELFFIGVYRAYLWALESNTRDQLLPHK